MKLKIQNLSIGSFCLLMLIVTLLMVGCNRSDNGPFLIPDIVVNLGEINSPYDDYNSTSPLVGETTPLCFSSNRVSNGNDFDVVFKLVDIFAANGENSLRFEENTNVNEGVYIQNANILDALIKLNDNADELGPYLIPQGLKTTGTTNSVGSYQSYICLYSSNVEGHQDIYFVHNLDKESYESPVAVPYLNSPAEDGYPSILEDGTKLLFCSNREGQFEIYASSLDV